MTAMMLAALNSARETAMVLMRAGCDTNILASNGAPALFCALQSGDAVIAELLADTTTAGEDRGQEREAETHHLLCAGLEKCPDTQKILSIRTRLSEF